MSTAVLSTSWPRNVAGNELKISVASTMPMAVLWLLPAFAAVVPDRVVAEAQVAGIGHADVGFGGVEDAVGKDDALAPRAISKENPLGATVLWHALLRCSACVRQSPSTAGRPSRLAFPREV